MGKSKYQLKAEKKIVQKAKPDKPKYYDEKIQQHTTMSKGAFALALIVIVVGAGTIIGIGLANRNDNDSDLDDYTPTTTTTNDPDVRTIQNGDSFTALYKLWVADEDGPAGTINLNTEPFQENTLQFTTDGVIAGFRENVLGMAVGEDKTFYLEIGEGYPEGQAYVDLDNDGIKETDLGKRRLAYYVEIISIP